jgi:proline utilization trans-activator
MENMHLFTSLMILCLAMSIDSRRPGSLHQKPDDVITYEAGKDVLCYMMESGSLAAKGHLNMLKEVEDLGKVIASNSGVGMNHEGEQWDIDKWMTQLFESEQMSNIFDI